MPLTLIVIGSPVWRADWAAHIGPEYTLITHDNPDTYLNTLIQKQAALIVVDDSVPNWEQWVTTPKISPATRRIPVIVLSDSPTIRARATVQGADFALAPAPVLGNLNQWLADTVRVLDADTLNQLDCECQDSLPPRGIEGVQRFNAGEYYRQHDLFEAQWVETSGPVRDLYRAILQVGVAYYQIQRGNYRGALKILQRSVQWLLILPDVCQGVNVKKLRDDSFRVRAELERLGPDRLAELDPALIGGVDWMPNR